VADGDCWPFGTRTAALAVVGCGYQLGPKSSPVSQKTGLARCHGGGRVLGPRFEDHAPLLAFVAAEPLLAVRQNGPLDAKRGDHKVRSGPGSKPNRGDTFASAEDPHPSAGARTVTDPLN
jgi:hypothetical protein